MPCVYADSKFECSKGEQKCLFPFRTPDALAGVHPSLLLFLFGSAFYTIATLYNDKHTETLRQSNRKNNIL